MPDSTIAQLADELMKREMLARPEQFRAGQAEPSREMRAVNPRWLALMGGLADAGTTYAFLKRGTGHEGNALLRGAGSPEMTALGALGGVAASQGILKLLRKMSPKASDAVAANLGNLQLQYALGNLETGPEGSSAAYQRKMQALAMRPK